MSTGPSCLTCERWKPKSSPAMARVGFARCELRPAWEFLPPKQVCDRHKPLTGEALAQRMQLDDPAGGEA